MDKRKLDSAVGKSSAEQHIRKSVHIMWKIYSPTPSETGSLAGWLAGKKFKNFKACCRLKYSIFCFVYPRYSIVSAILVHFQCFFGLIRLFYKVWNFPKPYDFVSIPDYLLLPQWMICIWWSHESKAFQKVIYTPTSWNLLLSFLPFLGYDESL